MLELVAALSSRADRRGGPRGKRRGPGRRAAGDRANGREPAPQQLQAQRKKRLEVAASPPRKPRGRVQQLAGHASPATSSRYDRPHSPPSTGPSLNAGIPQHPRPSTRAAGAHDCDGCHGCPRALPVADQRVQRLPNSSRGLGGSSGAQVDELRAGVSDGCTSLLDGCTPIRTCMEDGSEVTHFVPILPNAPRRGPIAVSGPSAPGGPGAASDEPRWLLREARDCTLPALVRRQARHRLALSMPSGIAGLVPGRVGRFRRNGQPTA